MDTVDVLKVLKGLIVTNVVQGFTTFLTVEHATAIKLEQTRLLAKMAYANVTDQACVLAKAQQLERNVLLVQEDFLDFQSQIMMVALSVSVLEDQETVSSLHILGLSLQCLEDDS